jgi:hypothetical protein
MLSAAALAAGLILTQVHENGAASWRDYAADGGTDCASSLAHLAVAANEHRSCTMDSECTALMPQIQWAETCYPMEKKAAREPALVAVVDAARVNCGGTMTCLEGRCCDSVACVHGRCEVPGLVPVFEGEVLGEILSRKEEFITCMKRKKPDQPKGVLVFHITVKDGRMKALEVEGENTEPKGVVRCLERAIRRIECPPGDGTAAFPLKF